MKWVLREDNISALIEFGKENLSSDNYLFVTTKDMLGQIEMNLDTFCTKIQRKTIISGFEEKIDKKLEEKIEKKLEIIPNVLPKIMISKRALVIFSIKKELIDKETLENFTEVDERLLPIVQIVNSFDYENPEWGKRDLDWLIDKIHGKEIEFTDHIPTKFELLGTIEEGEFGQQHGHAQYEPPFEDFRPVTTELIVASNTLAKHYDFSPELIQVQILMLELATKIDAENYRAVMELAPRYAQKGDWEKNKELLIKCLEINPKFSIARSMLSDAYTKLYQFSMALYEIEKVDLTKMPDFEKIAILVQKGTIKMIRGDLDGADLEFQNAHNIGKKTSDNWKHLVNGLYVGWYRCQNDKGDHKRALEILEFHKQYDPDSIPVWNNIGFQYNSLEEYGKAQYAYEHAYKIDNREPNVLMNLGLLYLRKNDDQTALKYFQNAKNSLEEGYEKFTEYQDGERTTKKLLEWMRYTITIITEGSSEDKEQLIIELGGKIQTGEELYPLPPPPVERKSEEYEGISKRCKIAIQNFLRKKYDSDPEKFRKDFPSNYDEAKKRLEQDKIRMHPQKNVDLFSFIDIGVFPFIFKMKIDAWKLDYDSVNLINALYKIKEMRNLKAHDMEMTPNQKEIRFRNEVELIEFFERKIMQ